MRVDRLAIAAFIAFVLIGTAAAPTFVNGFVAVPLLAAFGWFLGSAFEP